MARQPSRGEIWLADLNSTRGHVQAGKRPVLIISNNTFNHGPADLVFVLPLTTTDRRIPTHIQIDPPNGGLGQKSFILCDALRSISKNRLGQRAFGSISQTTLEQAEDILRILINL